MVIQLDKPLRSGRNPRKPKAFAAILSLVAPDHGYNFDRIADLPPTRKRIRYKDDPAEAVIDTLSANLSSWEPVLQRPNSIAVLRRLFERRKFADRESLQDQEAASRVCRRLFNLVGAGHIDDPRNLDQIEARVRASDGLPGLSPFGPDEHFHAATGEYLSRFPDDVQRYWRDAPWPYELNKGEPDLDPADAPIRDPAEDRRFCLADSALYRDQARTTESYALNPRNLHLAATLVTLLDDGDPAEMPARKIASYAAFGLCLGSGMKIEKCLEVVLRPGAEGAADAPARYDAETGLVWVQIGTYRHALSGRIPRQDVPVPLPDFARKYVDAVVRSGADSIAMALKNALGGKPRKNWTPLNSLRADAPKWENISCGSDCRRLHMAVAYIAVVQADLPPAWLGLIRGDHVNPYRSDSSYIGYSRAEHCKNLLTFHQELARFSGRPYHISVSAIPKIPPLAAEVPDGANVFSAFVERAEAATTQSQLWRLADVITLQALGTRQFLEQPHAPSLLAGDGTIALLGDKSVNGEKVRERPVAVCEPVMAAMRLVGANCGDTDLNREVGYRDAKTGEMVTYRDVQDPEAEGDRWVVSPRNALRKVYISESSKFSPYLSQENCGHGTSTTAASGPFGLIPIDHHFAQSRRIAEAILEKCGFERAVTAYRAAKERLGAGDIPSVTSSRTELLECEDASGIFAVPTVRELERVQQAREAIRSTPVSAFTLPDVRKALFVLLTMGGVLPVEYLRRGDFRRYLCPNSFFWQGGNLCLDTPIRQRDRKMGKIPLRIPPDLAPAILDLLARFNSLSPGSQSSRAEIFRARDLQQRPVAQFLRRFCPELRGTRIADISTSINSSGNWLCLLRQPSAIVCGLLNKLMFPLDYVSLPSLLDLSEGDFLSVTGGPWICPYTQSAAAKKRERLAIPILDLCRGIKEPRRGRPIVIPRYIPRDDNGTPCPPESWTDEVWIKFLREFHPEASPEQLKIWLERRGLGEMASRASTFCRGIHAARAASLGSPVRLLKSSQAPAFFTRLRPHLTREQMIICLLCYLFGVRSAEAASYLVGDLRCIGDAISLIDRGTKTRRANRVIDGHLFIGDDANSQLLLRELQSHLEALRRERKRRDGLQEPLIPPKKRGAVANKINAHLRRLNAEDTAALPDHLKCLAGRFSLHSFRHACAVRVVTEVVRTAYKSNYLNKLCSVARQLGHTLGCLIGTYVGGALILMPLPEEPIIEFAQPTSAEDGLPEAELAPVESTPISLPLGDYLPIFPLEPPTEKKRPGSSKVSQNCRRKTVPAGQKSDGSGRSSRKKNTRCLDLPGQIYIAYISP